MPGRDTRGALIKAAGGAAAATLVVVVLCYFRVLAPVDNAVYDLLLNARATVHQDAAHVPGLVLVTIDEESLGEMNRSWPWPRSWYGQLVTELHRAGARAIGLDILFVGPSEPAEDEQLAAALGAAKNAVLAGQLEGTERVLRDERVTAAVQRVVLPLPAFRQAARCGLVNFDFGTGKVVRAFVPQFTLPDMELAFPAFATAICETAGGRAAANARPELIDFVNPTAFDAVPAYQVLRHGADPAVFRGKIVLVGATFADAHDVYATPVGLRPGVEVHAHVLAGMSRGQRCILFSRWPQLALTALLGLLAGYLMVFSSGWWLGLVLSTVGLVTSVGVAALMVAWGVFVDPSYPLLVMPLSLLLAGLMVRKPLVLETKVGPYRLHEELGRGGMAVVYRARHPRTGEQVALKMMLPEFATDEASLARFLREIELLRELNHPNIVRIIDAGDVNGQPYYAMEYLEGLTLDQVIEQERRMSGSDVRRVAGAIARALAQAHELGVIHRDVKPGNIMLTRTGHPKLTDFGIARRVEGPHVTQAGSRIGTPHYLAPELINGEEPSPASDIYSFGATLFRLLSGRPPFAAKDPRTVLAMALTHPAPDVRTLAADVDEDLAKLVAECLAKTPEKRPPNMLTVARRLDPFYVEPTMVQAVPPSAAPASVPGRSAPPIPARRAVRPPAAALPADGATQQLRPPAPPPPRASVVVDGPTQELRPLTAPPAAAKPDEQTAAPATPSPPAAPGPHTERVEIKRPRPPPAPPPPKS